MSEIQVFVPVGFFGESDADTSLDWMLREIAKAVSTDSAECSDKYGATFENDVFLMHPYCWCEKQGECPWCTGCSYPDCKPCDEGRFPHLRDCYQSELKMRAAAFCAEHGAEDIYSVKYEVVRAFEDALYRDLCEKHGLSLYGCAIHCTCGAVVEREKARASNGCDYRLGKGIFARFAPWTNIESRDYYDPPNFWFKPSDFRAKWYKWIGRDVETNRDLAAGELQLIFDACVASLPEKIRAKALATRRKNAKKRKAE